MAAGWQHQTAPPQTCELDDGVEVPEFEFPSSDRPGEQSQQQTAGLSCARGLRVSMRVCLASSLNIACIPLDALNSAAGILCCPVICGIAAFSPAASATPDGDPPPPAPPAPDD
eukprot:Hpha_TRINITY_DN36448_c0_g1::TRINITY_DN36448_c0_g1_i1::g.20028::m.20028